MAKIAAVTVTVRIHITQFLCIDLNIHPDSCFLTLRDLAPDAKERLDLDQSSMSSLLGDNTHGNLIRCLSVHGSGFTVRRICYPSRVP